MCRTGLPKAHSTKGLHRHNRTTSNNTEVKRKHDISSSMCVCSCKTSEATSSFGTKFAGWSTSKNCQCQQYNSSCMKIGTLAVITIGTTSIAMVVQQHAKQHQEQRAFHVVRKVAVIK